VTKLINTQQYVILQLFCLPIRPLLINVIVHYSLAIILQSVPWLAASDP